MFSRLANWILTCVISRDDRQFVLGDLAEEYAVRLGDTSPASAAWWYWTQVLRSIPWLLWSPVRRSGLVSTLGVACAAGAAQAAVELMTAAFGRGVRVASPGGAAPFVLAVVLGSLVIVSYVSNRVRPGAGTLLALLAIASALARMLHAGIEEIHLAYLLESAAAPSAAFVGAALAFNFHPSRRIQ